MAKSSAPLSSSTNPFGRSPRRPGKRTVARALCLRDRVREQMRVLLAAPHWGRVGLFVLTVLALAAILSLHLLPDRVSLRVGEPSPADIRAMRPAQFADRQATRALRDAAARRVEPVYTAARFAASDADQSLSEAFALLRRERGQAPARVAALLSQEVGLTVLPPATLAPLLSPAVAASHLEQAERVAREAAATTLNGEIIRSDRPDNLSQARAEVSRAVASSMLPRADVPAVSALARAALRPNFQFDEAATARQQDVQRSLVAPVMRPIFAGEMVVRSSEVATPETVDKLRALGLQTRAQTGTRFCPSRCWSLSWWDWQAFTWRATTNRCTLLSKHSLC